MSRQQPTADSPAAARAAGHVTIREAMDLILDEGARVYVPVHLVYLAQPCLLPLAREAALKHLAALPDYGAMTRCTVTRKGNLIVTPVEEAGEN